MSRRPLLPPKKNLDSELLKLINTSPLDKGAISRLVWDGANLNVKYKTTEKTDYYEKGEWLTIFAFIITKVGETDKDYLQALSNKGKANLLLTQSLLDHFPDLVLKCGNCACTPLPEKQHFLVNIIRSFINPNPKIHLLKPQKKPVYYSKNTQI